VPADCLRRPVTISGRVNGDVVVFNGRVELRSGANVTGDVVSQQAPVVASGATIGGSSVSRPPGFLAFLVGWGILRVLALIPILGGLVWFAAVVFGLGALLGAIWRARTTSRPAPTAA
jgi:hypothetical protein